MIMIKDEFNQKAMICNVPPFGVSASCCFWKNITYLSGYPLKLWFVIVASEH